LRSSFPNADAPDPQCAAFSALLALLLVLVKPQLVPTSRRPVVASLLERNLQEFVAEVQLVLHSMVRVEAAAVRMSSPAAPVMPSAPPSSHPIYYIQRLRSN
jgi:hypothetical protein